MKLDYHIVTAQTKDVEDMRNLFVNTIRTVNSNDYTAEQIDVWAKSADDRVRWYGLISEQEFYLAKSGETLIGYISLKETNYLDFLYVHKAYQGHGIATKLFETIERRCQELGASELRSDVSITALPFFLGKGFIKVRENFIPKDGIVLTNYHVLKTLKGITP